MIKYIYVLSTCVFIAGSSAFAMIEEGPVEVFSIKRSTVHEALNDPNREKIFDVKGHQYRVRVTGVGTFAETFKKDFTKIYITCLPLSSGRWSASVGAKLEIDDDGNFISEDGIVGIDVEQIK